MDSREEQEAQESSALMLRQRSLRRAGHIQEVKDGRTKPRRDHPSPHRDDLPQDSSTHPPTFTSSPLSPTTSPFGGINKLGRTMTDALRKIQQASKTFNTRNSRSSRGGTLPAEPSADDDDARQKRISAVVPARSRSDVGGRSWTPTQEEKPTLVHHSNSAPAVPETRGQGGRTEGDEERRNGKPLVVRSDSWVSTASSTMGDVRVPPLLKEGTQMTKVTSKKRKKVVVRLNPDMGQIVWGEPQPAVRQRIIPIENIKEMRSGSDARYYREQFQLSQIYEDCWLTIIYILNGNYKTLHLVAPTIDVFRMWDATLRKLYAIRQELMSGLGNYEMRQALWEKQYWKGSNLEENERLRFGEVEKLCRRMNIHSSSEGLFRLFEQSDTKGRGYLDFDDFRRFVKLLRGRPELDRLYKKLVHASHSTKNGNHRNSLSSSPRPSEHGVFDIKTFEYFMREHQRSSLSHSELRILFHKYATTEGTSGSPRSRSTSPTGLGGVDKPNMRKQQRAFMTLDAFTSFLMSADNSVFLDQQGKAGHDMTRPLCDYFISSSHNTYLVGHQLVGVSTIEGYIRALLHGCRSVELDIYDGDSEPMIFHGKSFTSKVLLREVCHAIMKYGFVASPYPIIISAEVHCTVPQQDMIAEIMVEVFGDTLVKASPLGKPKVVVLPSPEELKGKILFKTKDITALQQDSSDSDLFTETSGTSSASESDALQDLVEYQSTKRVSSSMGMANFNSTTVVSPLPVPAAKSSVVPSVQSVIRKMTRTGKSPSSHSGSGNGSSGGGTNTTLGQCIVASPPPMDTVLGDALSPRSTSALGRRPSTKGSKKQPKISYNLQALMVYTVGVKFQGINKKLDYAPEHMFSLSETTANKIIKTGEGAGMYDLIKHCRSHLVRVYPKGLRVNSTNYEPHRYWSAGTQLVAMNWQTFDLGYMINHAMFQQNRRSGYVLKPAALRSGPGHKELLAKKTSHYLDLTIISAQQLPRPKDLSGKDTIDKVPVMDPYVEVTVHVPDWTYSQTEESKRTGATTSTPPEGTRAEDRHVGTIGSATTHGTLSARNVTYRTSAVKNNGFNPIWEEKIRIPFECVGDMLDLVFVRFVVRQEDKDDEDPLAIYCVSLGSLGHGYRHLPLHDGQLSQYLFSTLFVRVEVEDVG